MSNPQEVYWAGRSGQRYNFWTYVRGTTFSEPCPGIYIHAKVTPSNTWAPVYIGQTEDINVRLTNHEQENCVNQNGATHIHIRIVKDEDERLAAEKDLIQQWEPPCNTHFVS
jgi:hypothetical protein